MLEFPFFKKYDKPICLALGFFDCIHQGHRVILNKCKEKARLNNCESAVITFKNNPNKNLHKQIDLIYTYNERIKILEKLEMDIVISGNFDNDFMIKSAESFLSELVSTYNIKYIVCGKDYNFGYKGKGDVFLLKSFCNDNNIEFEIADDVIINDKKVSSTLIRQYLAEGEIIKANLFLKDYYHISGTVVAGNKIGRKLLFPTINLHLDNQKQKLKQGVYFTRTLINNKYYYSVTNCGGRPTFDNLFYKVETHILNFNKDVYGEEAYVEFIDKIRDTKAFSSVDELIKQIKQDIKFAEKIINKLN